MQEGLIRPVKPDVTQLTDGSSTSAPTRSRRRRPRCGARWPTPRSATTSTARIRPSTGCSRSRRALLGTEAALYVPSGTMANQLAIRVLLAGRAPRCCARRGRTCTATSSRRRRRTAACSCTRCGTCPTASSTALEGSGTHEFPPISCSSLENTYMAMSGAPTGADGDAHARRARARRRARGALRRRADLERGDRHSASRRASSIGRRRHRDVLPVEGLERAGRLVAVRPGRRDRRGPGAAPPPRRRHAPGRA